MKVMKGMNVVVAGIDIGIKNLAVCVFDCNTRRIMHWENYSVAATTPYKMCQNLVSTLDDVHFEEFGVEKVMIEKQPPRGARAMQEISQWVYCYFAIRGLDAVFVNARTKFNHALGRELRELLLLRVPRVDEDYRARKRLAVRVACEFLARNASQNEGAKRMFESMRKKDDLADSLMYCLTQTS